MSATFSNLIEALREHSLEKGYLDIANESSVFATIFDDIGSAMASWNEQTLDMLNPHNWRLDTLARPDGSFRKPKIYLYVDTTKKGNLVLEWYPWPPDVFPKIDDTDWIYWSNNRPIGSGMTDNRLIMIHKFNSLSGRLPSSQAETYLLEAIVSLLQEIYSFLGRLFDVTVVEDLFLEYSIISRHRQITDACIRRKEEEKPVESSLDPEAHRTKVVVIHSVNHINRDLEDRRPRMKVIIKNPDRLKIDKDGKPRNGS